MDGRVLPLAITMMAGPQIMSAILFVTRERNPVQVSLAYVSAVALAVAAGVSLARLLADVLHDKLSLSSSGPTTAAKWIEIGLVALLLLLAIKAYLGRETSEPPKWMGKLQAIQPKGAFRLGLLLIFLMPSDVAIMLTTGVDLKSHGLALSAAIPFWATTVLIAALPLIFYLAFRKRATRVMPRLRDWMNTKSWLVNIFVYALFIVLILA